MKIRIKGNSLRYRLTRSDLDKFSAEGYIEETINFGMQTLTYALQENGLNNLSALFEKNKITLFIHSASVSEWTLTDRVGFEHLHNGLFLLVEKDFKCLDNVAEDQSDNYPNPQAKNAAEY